MKTAELKPNKSYLVYNRDHWIDATYSSTYYKTADNLRQYKWRPVLNENGTFRIYNNKIQMVNKYDRTQWVVLRHIRAEFYEAVALITKTNQNRWDEGANRAKKYAQHLKRKADRAQREIEKPIEDAFLQALKQAGAEYAWRETKLVHLPIEVMQKITNALTNN